MNKKVIIALLVVGFFVFAFVVRTVYIGLVPSATISEQLEISLFLGGMLWFVLSVPFFGMLMRRPKKKGE